MASYKSAGLWVSRGAFSPRRRIGSIVFVLSSLGEVAVANRYPYVFKGIQSESEGDLKSWSPGVGTYELTALPYRRNRGRGNQGRSSTVNFEVIDSRHSSPGGGAEPEEDFVPGGGDGGGSSAVPPPEPTSQSAFSAVWGSYGGEKIVQEEVRASDGKNVNSSLWDGGSISTFAARNEVVSFQVVLEAATKTVSNVSASFFELVGPGGVKIRSVPRIGSEVFDYRDRPIELFYVRYLPIKGLSLLSYDTYDERHIPKKLRRPFTGEGFGSGTWSDRPNHDLRYPEIAVPFEFVNSFQVEKEHSQSLWSDIYVPKSAVPGTYYGRFRIYESGKLTRSILVSLEVSAVTLPDEPESKTMVYLGYSDVNRRYLGEDYPSGAPNQQRVDLIRNNHFKVAHRHKISLIDANDGATAWNEDAPRPEWHGRLNGSLFTATHGYDGPGVGVGNNVFSIGTYGFWPWRGQGQAAMWTRTNNWENWFVQNAPSTERFLYLIDESHDFSQTNSWASWINSNPGVGKNLRSFATIDYPNAFSNTPQLDIAAAWMAVGPKQTWQNAANSFLQSSAKKAYMYNGKRPASGSFAIEDDGVALRELPWGQFKEGISRWFFWESTYYNNFQAGAGETNVYQSAHTFGGNTHFDNVLGRTGWNYSNGDGVLFYPGTDLVFPAESYGVKGPIVSIRLKHWRRGIQDVDYISLAMKKDPARTLSIIDQMVPLALWDYGIEDPSDPTWKRTDISWPTDPEVWEEARRKLQEIILK